MVFPVIAQLDGIIEHGSGFMSYLDAHGDHYVGGFSLVGGAVGVPKLTFSNTILYVTITQDGEDSDGNPIYKSDKTYEEIKAAHEAGREVKIARAGVFEDETLLTLGINDFSLDFIDAYSANFTAVGVPAIPTIPSAVVGGQILSAVFTSIFKDGQVKVNFPFDIFDGEITWHESLCYKLPQQYIVTVTAGTDGTLSANNTLAQLNSVAQAYSFVTDVIGSASINANYNGKLYYMSDATDASLTFTATTENGLETLTVSNDGEEGSADVWTHEVVPLRVDNSFKVTLTSKVSGGYDIDKTFNEVVKAYNDNKYIYALFQNKNNFEFLSLDKFLVLGVEGYALIAFSNEHRYIVFRSSGGSALIYDKSRSSDMTILRGGDAMSSVPVTTADNGKFLRVVDGQWAADAVENAKGVNF